MTLLDELVFGYLVVEGEVSSPEGCAILEQSFLPRVVAGAEYSVSDLDPVAVVVDHS